MSIIIPTYNRANIIGETLDSVLAQTYANWECIVVDDGSSDTTVDIMREYLERDKRFQYYHRPMAHLAGGNGARNYGFSKSTGDYIQWFDSDDVMFPDFINCKIKPFLRNPETDVVFSAFKNVYENGSITQIGNHYFSGNILNDLVDGHVSFGPLSFMLRKDIIRNIKYDETLKKSQDLEFFFRLFTADIQLNIVHIKEILYKVRTHKGSITHGTSRDILKMASIYKVSLMLLDYFENQKNRRAIKKYKFRCLNCLKMMLQNGNYREAINRLLSFQYLNILQKAYLMGCTVSHFLIKRGANQFIKIISDEQ